MAYDKGYFNLLKKDRDDARRAAALDEAYPNLPEEVQQAIDHYLLRLTTIERMGEQQAKSLLICMIMFVNMKVDEQDRWRAHGEAVRRKREWTEARSPMTRVLELV